MRWDRVRDALHFLADERAFRLRLFCEGALVGIGVGIVVALFRWLLGLTEIYLPILFDWMAKSFPVGFIGWGIFLVRKNVDDISYEYKDGKNILTIRKNIVLQENKK